MKTTNNLGARGEAAAKKYLLENSYKILATNYRSGHKEIDIICEKNKNYIFIEVKTRLKTEESLNENPLSSLKVKKLKIAILDYARKYSLNLNLIYLDLIIILVNKNNNTAELKHYRNVF